MKQLGLLRCRRNIHRSSRHLFCPSTDSASHSPGHLHAPSRPYRVIRTHQAVHHQAYKLHLTAYKDALIAAKSAYLSAIFSDPCQNPRTLFSTVSNLLKSWTSTLSTSTPDLCNSFLQLFADKITAINHSLFPVHNPPAHSMAPLWTSHTSSQLPSHPVM
ncbi:unnamed protein product [Boreogadus saida]